MLSVPLVLLHPHLQAIVGSDDWSFVIDRRNVDIGYTWQTVLTDFCLVGHYCEAVLFSFTAIMNVGDVLALHLEAKKGFSSKRCRSPRIVAKIGKKNTHITFMHSNLSVCESSDGHSRDPAML